ncbi:MAG: hypothetical protein WAM24_01160 [Ignavibacteriaceae bacterium]
MIEILILNIKEGMREEFHNVYVTQSLPLLKKWKINVVAHGKSLHNENTYYVIRLFKSLEDRQKSEDAFYGSEEWEKGPREAIISKIESSAEMVVKPENLKDWLEIIKD